MVNGYVCTRVCCEIKSVSVVDGLWDTGCPYTRTIGSVMSPITKMLAVAGKLWCGCQNSIHVINPLMLTIEVSAVL